MRIKTCPKCGIKYDSVHENCKCLTENQKFNIKKIAVNFAIVMFIIGLYKIFGDIVLLISMVTCSILLGIEIFERR